MNGINEDNEETEEPLIEAVKAIAAEAGVTIHEGGVSAIHCIGKRGRHNRPVIVRFVSRLQKQRTIKNRKQLKNNERIRENGKFGDKLTVTENLTAARYKMLKVASEQECVDYAFASDGAIHCKLKNGKFVKLESADDLFKIGMEDVNYADFYRD